MKLHHLLAVLCVVLLVCFGTLLAIHFNQSGEILALENQLLAMTAERDQLATEIEILNKNLESQKAASEEQLNSLKSQLSHIQEQYNKLFYETTPDREYPDLLEKAFKDAAKKQK